MNILATHVGRQPYVMKWSTYKQIIVSIYIFYLKRSINIVKNINNKIKINPREYLPISFKFQQNALK